MKLPHTIADALGQMESGKLSAEDLVRAHLSRIDEADDKLHAVLTRLDEGALEQARRIDEKRRRGESLGVLAGIPFTVKDMFLITGTKTTAASQILKDFTAPYTATAVSRLEAEGAICIAKVNQDEYGHGGSTENSSFGVTRNPYDLERVSGGSSGGSAAAVAAGIGLFSMGTDTGGSSRQPAAFCGVVGMKPTYGLISRFGVIAMASSLDTVGTLAGTVADAALVCSVMARRDANDATTIELDNYDFSQVASAPRRVAIIREYIDGLSESVRSTYEAVFSKLKSAGWDLETVSLKHIGLSLPTYYILTPAEISSNLERYDGIRYGTSEKDAPDLGAVYSETRGRNFGEEVKRRILTGTYVLSAGYYDAYYKKAMQLRTKIRHDFEKAFSEYDILIGPTTPNVAFKIGENADDPIAMYMADIMTVAANLAGIPAISIPVNGPNGMPLGLQLMAPQKAEASLFAAARSAETVIAAQREGIVV